MRNCSTKDKLEFVFAMSKHSDATIRDIQAIMRYGTTYGNLAEEQCNRQFTDEDYAKRDRIKAQLRKLCESIGVSPVFQNDPRGNTVKIAVRDGYTTDWGREGISVPTS